MRAIHTFDLDGRSAGVRLPASGLDYYGECQRASFGESRPGGDFFELAPLGGGRIMFSLGSMSGGGEAGNVLATGLQRSLRNFALEGRGKIAGTVQALNRMMCELPPEDLYATLFYASLDPVSRELRYVSAGHEPVLLVRRNPPRVRHLESTGAVLGLTRRTEYRQRTVWLEPGDLVVAFSGGISDATDARGRELCEAGVLEIVNQCPDAGAANMARHIITEVGRFTGGAPARDDRTVVVARFHGAEGEAFFTERREEHAFAAA